MLSEQIQDQVHYMEQISGLHYNGEFKDSDREEVIRYMEEAMQYKKDMQGDFS